MHSLSTTRMTFTDEETSMLFRGRTTSPEIRNDSISGARGLQHKIAAGGHEPNRGDSCPTFRRLFWFVCLVLAVCAFPACQRKQTIRGEIFFAADASTKAVPVLGQEVYVMSADTYAQFHEEILIETERIVSDFATKYEDGTLSTLRSIHAERALMARHVSHGPNVSHGPSQGIAKASPEVLQALRRECQALRGRFKEVSRQYSVFVKPGWRSFYYRAAGPPVTLLPEQREEYDLKFRSVLDSLQKSIEDTEEKIEDTMNQIQRLKEEEREDLLRSREEEREDLLRSQNLLTLSVRELSVAMDYAKKAEETNETIYLSVRAILQSLPDTILAKTNSKGEFVFPRPRGNYVLFAPYRTEFDGKSMIIYWKYQATPDDEFIVLDNQNAVPGHVVPGSLPAAAGPSRWPGKREILANQVGWTDQLRD